ncbi:malate synthase A [Salipaludibacillus aurantiacus]|uniref:Malate synthase n=1 Tax=Salipaludibacillus aurantiacus TaxID=1601833 RepID=A0A1H9VTV1_9BACI|nr:malate synthase A [Salipaludibacillus aurantiacus]SES24961.1 malate synthase [Salipaludibacillus aurantiacus]
MKELKILREPPEGCGFLLTEEALNFLMKLHQSFGEERKQLLQQRGERQREIDSGLLPHYLGETKEVRDSEWTVAPVPEDIQDRRVEITGPTSNRKMVINALNSGAKVFMADFEDANSPSWLNTLQGQKNMYDAIRREIDFTADNGKDYVLAENPATLFVRPRGWHLEEKHVKAGNEFISASLFDFGLYIFHNSVELLKRGSGPYFYLPKLEGYKEARLWNDVFTFAEKELGLDHGTIKATVLIETLTGSFEADEILYELRDHSAGLNCGRWDYIFSYIKRLRNHKEFILPDRSEVTMTVNFMRAYTQYVIQTCHKRGAHAIGGMAAQIPVKDDPEKNEKAMQKVREDKEREVKDGHDGTWVAHPGLVPVAMEVFDEHMPQANQVSRQRDDVNITEKELLAVPKGQITEEGVRLNITVSLQYMEAWLRGQGAVPIFNLMEDVATAEISRAQLWQWINHPEGKLPDGEKITVTLVKELIEEEVEKLKQTFGDEKFTAGKFKEAEQLLTSMIEKQDFEEFMTIPAYEAMIKQKESV